MNLLDRCISWVDPTLGIKRMQARSALARYEAVVPNKQRRRRMDTQSPNALVGASARQLRATARDLERNHDITRGALRMVNNIIGPHGIGIEPQPLRRDGTIHEEYAAGLREVYRKWRRRPEVTHSMRAAMMERMICYTWLRDGECFEQKVIGTANGVQHGSELPFSLEVLEPDFVPLEYTDKGRNINQGVQVNAWGRVTGYHVYRGDPREGMSWLAPSDLKFVPLRRV
jgi:lambda family phage portal protein